MKNIFLSILTVSIIFVVFSCKGGKDLPSVQKGSTEVSLPLSGRAYQSDANFFRATQSGKSTDLSNAKRVALINAKAELASAVGSTIKTVSTNYANERTIGDRQDFASRFDTETREVVNQMLNDVAIIEEKVFRETNGSYTYWIAVEMNKDALLRNVNDRISKDEKLNLDFDQHQFRKVFDEEMNKFENR